MIRELLDEQIAYYRARAEEYDEWFFRRGKYDRGEDFLRTWFSEIATVESALRALRPYGDVLELACGTGLWTRHLIDSASTVTAVDASAEVIEINQQRARMGQEKPNAKRHPSTEDDGRQRGQIAVIAAMQCDFADFNLDIDIAWRRRQFAT